MNEQAIRRSLLGQVSTTLGASVLVLLALTAANVLIARTLGVAGQGTVTAATLLPMIVAYAGELGIPVATAYLISSRPAHRNETIAVARFHALVTGGLLVLISLTLTVLLTLPAEARNLSMVYSAFAFISLLHRLHLAILQADLRLSAFNRIRVAGAGVYLVLLVLYFLTGSATPLLVIVALLVANGVWCILSGWLAFSRPFVTLNWSRSRELISYGSRAHVGNVSAIDALRLDHLVLALFLSTYALGLYVAAMTVIMANRLIGISVGMVAFPIAARSRSASGEDRSQLRVLMLGTLLAAGMVVIPELALGGGLLGVLFGEDFAPAGEALRILAVGSIFMNVRQVYGDWLRGSGRPGVVALSELVGLGFLVLLPLMIWNGSIERVAWVMSVSAVAALLSLAVFDKGLGRRFPGVGDNGRDLAGVGGDSTIKLSPSGA